MFLFFLASSFSCLSFPSQKGLKKNLGFPGITTFEQPKKTLYEVSRTRFPILDGNVD
jgi:hypothetical protein